MNTRLLSSAFLFVLLATQVASVYAAKPPKEKPMPNFSKKEQSVATPSQAQGRQQAVARLEARVPESKVDFDPQRGGVRHVAGKHGFLTGPGGQGKGVSREVLETFDPQDPHRSVKAFLKEHKDLFGHDDEVLDTAQLKSDFVAKHSGMRTLSWQQELDGIPVFEGVLISHLTKNDELISISDGFALAGIGNRAAAIARGRQASLSARAAVELAAGHLGEEIVEGEIQADGSTPEGPEQKQAFRSSKLRGTAYAQKVWYPLSPSKLMPAWQIILTARVRPEMYLMLVDSRNGEILLRRCLTDHASDATYNVYPSDSPSPFSPGLPAPGTFQPPLVPRDLITLTSLDSEASPDGWIDDGVNETLGNNVDAHLDRDDDDQPDLPRPTPATNRVFNFQLDLSKSPVTYGDAAVVNLFYWNNFCHDKMYQLGFTEEAGNFQTDNFGKGGLGNDAVEADGQDGGGFNNANFATPPDGYPGRMQMYLFDGPNPDRDGDLDSEIMIHEYTHGLSTRLLGGPEVGISELQPRGMGEGWSDFYALSLLSQPDDDPHGSYAAAAYASYRFFGLNENYYFGIRRYPYSTDLNKNPLTFKDIDPTQASPHAGVPTSPISGGGRADEVHNMGEVWCITLWEARAALVDKLGGEAGNWMMLQLVTDGLKLAPRDANYIEARDAILQADEVFTGGDNLAELWIAFAKRGMGFSASAPPSDTTIGVVEAFDLPDFIQVGPPDGVLELKVAPPSFTALFSGTTNVITVRVTDSVSVTNAEVMGTASAGQLSDFRNDGIAPDLTASNAIYSATFVAPPNSTNVTITLQVTAPEKEGATNAVVYTIIKLPTNNNFTNAIKVAAAGGTFTSNNKFATTEQGEPVHAGVTNSGASLWWNYTPASNVPLLVDTASSAIATVVAVYTNNTLQSLAEVASAADGQTRSQAFVQFNAKSGVNYHIAVASQDKTRTGTIQLSVLPMGIPDTNAPDVAVVSPLSGTSFNTNKALLSGTAIDPDPSPSGVKELRFSVLPGVNSVPGFLEGEGGSVFGASALTSSNWTQSIGLFKGVNNIRVTAVDFAGNVSPPQMIQLVYIPLDPFNDTFVRELALDPSNSVVSGNTLNATKQPGEPNHAGNAGGKSAWWTFTPPQDGVLQLSTTNSTFDTLLAVYTGNTVSNLTVVAENDDAAGDGTFSELSAAVRSNVVYHVAVDGYDGVGGAMFLHYGFNPEKIFRLTIAAPVQGGNTSPGSTDVHSNQVVSVNALVDSGFVFKQWSGDIVSVQNPFVFTATSDMNLVPEFSAISYTDGFESGDFSQLDWILQGGAPWLVESTNVASGNFAARSGAIGNSSSSSLKISSVFRAGNGSFSLSVSSEANFDFLRFLVDDVQIAQWSGELGWFGFGFPLSAGAHTLEWRYSKDASGISGSDAAFIDNVDIPIKVAPNGSAPAILSISELFEGGQIINLQGQANQEYFLQYSADLVDWELLASSVAEDGFAQFVDSTVATNGARFYRAVVLE